jgi:hypothetical protein
MGTQKSKLHVTVTRRGDHPDFSKDWLPAHKIEKWTVSENKEAVGKRTYLFCAQSKAFNYPWTRYERCVSFYTPKERDDFLAGLALRKP